MSEHPAVRLLRPLDDPLPYYIIVFLSIMGFCCIYPMFHACRMARDYRRHKALFDKENDDLKAARHDSVVQYHVEEGLPEAAVRASLETAERESKMREEAAAYSGTVA